MLTIPYIEGESFLLQIWSLTWKPQLVLEEPVLIVWTNEKHIYQQLGSKTTSTSLGRTNLEQ